MHKLLPIVFLSVVACGAVFHSANAPLSQQVECGDVERLVLRTSLQPDEVATKRSSDDLCTIAGRWSYEIAGYHGSRKAAGVGPVPAERRRLTVDREDRMLTVSSLEFTYIHHALLLSKVSVAVPDGVKLVVEPYSSEQLHANARSHSPELAPRLPTDER